MGAADPSGVGDPSEALLPPWKGTAILLVDLDAFFASVEQLDHPAWRGKPVIVGGDADRHGVVSTCSYEARAYGVRSAMPASIARTLCPDAIWTHGRFSRYREMSNAIMSILRDETPHVQQVSIDEAFMDVTPTKVNTEHPVLIARRIQQRVEELGVTCSIGVGSTKSVAKIASDRDKPRGITVVYPGGEEAFLGPLPVRTLSGVGAAAERALTSCGVRTLGDMARADEGLLRRVFGKNADMMRARAAGRDVSPVVADNEVKSVSHEVTFADDLTTREEVQAAVGTLAAKVGRRLRRKGLKGRTLALKVRFDDRSTRSAQTRLPRPADNEIAFAPQLSQLVDELWMPGLKVRLLGVAMSGFADDAPVQEALFELEPTPTPAEEQRSGRKEARAEETDDVPETSGSAQRRSQRDEPAPRKKTVPRVAHDEKLSRSLLAATDALKDKFGEEAVRFGRELRNEGNTTGSSSKNPADYK